MQAPNLLRKRSDLVNWLVALVVTSAVVVIAYQWLDQPISFFVHDHLRHYEIFDRLTRAPELASPLAAVIMVILGLRALAGRRLSRPETVLVLCSVSLMVANFVKNQLKFVFGRTWPETWVNNNPSLIRDGVYGFNFFHGGAGYESFPSGHTAAVCAVMSVLWLCYPRFRPLYAVIVALVAIGLIGADYHFVGDVIGGGFIGVSIGWIAVAMWRASPGERV